MANDVCDNIILILKVKVTSCRGVGHDHVHHEVLRKIIRLNTVILFVESTESHNSYFIVITYNHSYC